MDPRCKSLRKAKAGAYHYKRVQVAGSDKYADKPDKGMYSHVAEAEQYLCLGAGEGKTIIRRAVDPERWARRAAYALSD